MSRRSTGTILIAVSAFLYAAHFIAAAIFGSGVLSWDAGLFKAMLEYTDHGLHSASLISLIGGVLYLIWAEFSEVKGKTKES